MTTNVTVLTGSLSVPTITGPGSTIRLFTNINEYQASLSTSSTGAQNIFTLATTDNTSYFMRAEVSAKSTTGTGGGNFVQSKGIQNNSNTLTVSANLENAVNATGNAASSTITISSSGTNIILNVTPGSSSPLDWVAYIRIVSSS